MPEKHEMKCPHCDHPLTVVEAATILNGSGYVHKLWVQSIDGGPAVVIDAAKFNPLTMRVAEPVSHPRQGAKKRITRMTAALDSAFRLLHKMGSLDRRLFERYRNLVSPTKRKSLDGFPPDIPDDLDLLLPLPKLR